jgi:hypothetical protein
MTPEERDRFVLLRVIVTRSTTSEAIKQLRRHFEKIARIPNLSAQDRSDGAYGVALLVPTSEGAKALRASVKRSGLDCDHFIHVEPAPGAAEYTTFMREWKRTK